MSKRPKKRFWNEEQILQRMEHVKQKAEQLEALADSKERLFHRLLDTEEEYRREELWDEVCKLRTKARNLIEKKLKVLGDKLSTLKTPLLLKVDGEDGSVEAI